MSEIDRQPDRNLKAETKNESPSLGSQVSALWHDAYENRGAIGAVAAGVAVAGVAYAAEHTALGRVLGLSKDILVIEDTSLFSHCIQRSLLSQGEKVTIIKGIESLKPFIGILEDDSTKALNLHKFRAAFVDGNLIGKFHGPDIVPALKDKNVFAVAMSSEPKVNDQMVALGADIAAQKSIVMQMLRENDLRVPQAIKEPARLQADLNESRVHFNEPAQVAKRKNMEREIMAEFTLEEAAIEAKKAAAEAAKMTPVKSVL